MAYCSLFFGTQYFLVLFAEYTSYSSCLKNNDYSHLPVVEHFDYLRNIRIPEGVFFSAKGLVKKNDYGQNDGDDEDDYSGGSSMLDGVSYGPSSPVQQFTGLPASHNSHRPSSSSHGLYSVSGQHNLPSSSPGAAYHAHHASDAARRPSLSRGQSNGSNALPRLSSVAPLPPTGHFALHSPHSPQPLSPNNTSSGHYFSSQPPSPQNYRPLSSEDRRALNTFKVVL